MFGYIQSAAIEMGKDHLVKICGQNVPNKHEECGCDRVSRKQDGLLGLVHGLVVGGQDIEVPAKLVTQGLGCRSVLATRLPKVVGREGPAEDRTGGGNLPTSSRFLVQIGQPLSPKVHLVSMSEETKAV